MPQYSVRSKSSQDSPGSPAHALVALGANVPSRFGAPAETLRAALRRLDTSPLHLECASRIFSSPCFPPGAGPDYVNSAAIVSGMDEAHAVLNALNAMETEFGRRRGTRWGHRTLDLDLIAFGNSVLPDPETYGMWRGLSTEVQRLREPGELVLPHPRLQDRAFVLVPLLEVAPEWKHPVIGLTVAEMHDALPEGERAAVIPL